MPNPAKDATVSFMNWAHLVAQITRLMLEDRHGRRRDRPFNQKSLAQAAGLHDTAVRDILKGRSKKPEIPTVMAIAGALGVPIEQLVGTRESGTTPNLKGSVTPPSHDTQRQTSAAEGGDDMSILRVTLIKVIADLPDDLLPAAKTILDGLRTLRGASPIRPHKPGRTL
jgi:DNA-binding XRE family transcriptional regulator